MTKKAQVKQLYDKIHSKVKPLYRNTVHRDLSRLSLPTIEAIMEFLR